MAKQMVLVYLLTLMALCMRDNGKMTSSMDMARRAGIITKSSLLVSLSKEKKQEKVDSSLKVDTTKEILSMASFTASVNITLLILADFTKVSLKTTTWKVKVK